MEGHILSLHQIRCEKEQKNLQESERIFPAVLFFMDSLCVLQGTYVNYCRRATFSGIKGEWEMGGDNVLVAHQL